MLEKWRTSPYYDQLSWNEFLEYWLPYRADGEKFSDFYEVLSERYAPIRDSLQEGKSIVEVTNLLEKELRTWLKFDLRAHALLNKPSILETIKSRKGGCNTLTEFVCMALRTIGIVAAIDAPYGHTVIPVINGMLYGLSRENGFLSMEEKI